MPGHGAQHQGHVVHTARERPALVEAGGKRHHPVAADAAVGRLHAHHPGERGGLPDAAAGIGPGGEEGLSSGHRRGRSAAAAARHGRRVPRVADRAVGAVLVARSHGELVAVGLAEQHRAGCGEALLGRRGVRRAVAGQDLRSRRGRQAAVRLPRVVQRPGDEDVLQGVRDAEQRPRVAVGERDVRRISCLQRSLHADRQEGVERFPVPRNAGQGGLAQLARADLSTAQQLPHLDDRPVSEGQRVGHRANDPLPG